MRLEIPRLVHCYSWPRGKHTTEVVSRRKRMFCVGCVAISFLIYIRVTSFLFFLWFESVMLIAWHISQLFLYVMDGYYIYIYHFFPLLFSGAHPKVTIFSSLFLLMWQGIRLESWRVDGILSLFSFSNTLPKRIRRDERVIRACSHWA